MKKLISLTVVFVILCAMTVCPVAFADEVTSDNAYEWMDISKLPTSSANRNYVTNTNVPRSSNGYQGSRYDINGNNYFNVDGEGNNAKNDAAALEASVAIKLGHKSACVFGSMDFGNTVPKAIEFKILNGNLTDTSDGLNGGCYINVYAFPVGTTISTTLSQGCVTSFTLPGETEEKTDASDYLLLNKVNRYAGKGGIKWDREKGDPMGLSSCSYKLDATKAAALIDSSKDSNPWIIVIGCGTVSGNYCAFNGFQFHEEGLNAESVLSVYPNLSSQMSMKKQTAYSGDVFTTNLSLDESGMEEDEYEAYITIDDVNFGDTARQLAAVFNYGKGANFNPGDFVLYIDADDDGVYEADEVYAAVTTATTSSVDSTGQTHSVHKGLLNKNITGVHDVKIDFSESYMAALYTLRFEEVDPETDVYGDVTVAKDTGTTTYSVNMPIRKEYIKGAGKCIVALYNADGEGNPVSLSKLTSGDFTIATDENSADYGWDTTSATITFEAEDIEGKVVKAFLWKDMNNLVPLSAASATAGVVTAQ